MLLNHNLAPPPLLLYNKFKEVAMAFKCPRCNQVNKDGSDTCWSCHTIFATGEKKPLDMKVKKSIFSTLKREKVDFKVVSSDFPGTIALYFSAPPKERYILARLTVFFLVLNLFNNIIFYYFKGVTQAQENAGSITTFLVVFIAIYSAVICIARLKADTDFPGKTAYFFYLFFIPIFAFGYIVPSYYPNFRLFLEGALLIWNAVLLRP
jgi:hypothetical protein